MNFDFYIFGTPDSFEIYNENTNDRIKKIQDFNDGSKENTKLTIQRRGQIISYSYLRYNLLSCRRQQGAFFGMSVVFNGAYCTDVKNLYALFDAVYGIIVKNGVLLKESINGQFIFGVHSLKEAAIEINKVESIVRKNLEKKFANDFGEIDNTFKQGVNLNEIEKLNITRSNKTILASLKDYPVISISPEYKEKGINTKVTYPRPQQKTVVVTQNVMEELGLIKTSINELKNKVESSKEEGNTPNKQKKEASLIFSNTSKERLKVNVTIILIVIIVTALIATIISIYIILNS